MATNFPTTLDSYTNPASTDLLSNPPHHSQHDNINDAVVALETKVGVDNSAVTTTLDYILKHAVTPSTQAIGDTAVNGTSGTVARGDHKHQMPVAADIYALAQSIDAQTASYTLVLADAGKLVTMSNASANNLTVPLNASVAFAVGTRIDVASIGAGQTTVVATGGVTINATPGLKLRAQYSGGTLVKTATDTWLLFGDLSA